MWFCRDNDKKWKKLDEYVEVFLIRLEQNFDILCNFFLLSESMKKHVFGLHSMLLPLNYTQGYARLIKLKLSKILFRRVDKIIWNLEVDRKV